MIENGPKFVPDPEEDATMRDVNEIIGRMRERAGQTSSKPKNRVTDPRPVQAPRPVVTGKSFKPHWQDAVEERQQENRAGLEMPRKDEDEQEEQGDLWQQAS